MAGSHQDEELHAKRVAELAPNFCVLWRGRFSSHLISSAVEEGAAGVLFFSRQVSNLPQNSGKELGLVGLSVNRPSNH